MSYFDGWLTLLDLKPLKNLIQTLPADCGRHRHLLRHPLEPHVGLPSQPLPDPRLLRVAVLA